MSDTTLTRDSIFILALAFVVRLIFLFQFSDSLLFANHVVDMAYHHQWALSLANGESFYDGPFFRAPLYPFFLGGLYSLFGDSSWLTRLTQISLGSVSCLWIYLVTIRLFSRPVALIASAIMILYAPLFFFEAQLLSVALTIFLYLGGLFYAVRAVQSGKITAYLLTGLFFGLGAVCRPNILLFTLILGGYLIWKLYRKSANVKVASVGIYILGLLLPIIPVSIYNTTQSGQFTAIGSYGGINLYIGNYEQADGVSAVIPGVRPDWQGGYEDTWRIAEAAEGRALTGGEVSDYWRGQAVDVILDDPLRVFALTGKKLLLLASGIELSNNFDFYYFIGQQWLSKVLIWPKIFYFPFGLLLPLAVVGLFILKSANEGRQVLYWYIIGYTVSIILFLVTARYRMPLIPPLIILAAVGVHAVKQKFKQLSGGYRIALAGCFIVAAVVANIDWFGYAPTNHAQGFHTEATIYNRIGQTDKAEAYYKKAIEADNQLVEAINDLALLWDKQGKTERAIKLISQSLDNPNATYVNWFNLGYLYMRNGEYKKAIGINRKVLEDIPNYPYALNNLGRCYRFEGLYDSSNVVYHRLLTSSPTFYSAYYDISLNWLDNGNGDSARVYLSYYLQVALASEPDYPVARFLLDSLSN